jgi:putative glutamine amidotransferase
MVTQVHRERDETDFAVLEHAFQMRKPLLGICFGMQSLNVYQGGTLIQDIPSLVPGAAQHDGPEAHHDASVEPGSSLAIWSGGARKIRVNSSHHQAIDKTGRDLRVTARAPDGVIEALEGSFPDHFIIAVAWHPERIWKDEPLSARLFTELIAAATRRASEPRAPASGTGR